MGSAVKRRLANNERERERERERVRESEEEVKSRVSLIVTYGEIGDEKNIKLICVTLMYSLLLFLFGNKKKY